MNGSYKPALFKLIYTCPLSKGQCVQILHFREMDDDVISSGHYVYICRPDAGQDTLKGNKVNISLLCKEKGLYLIARD